MKCSDFLARFSEFHDGDPSLENREEFEAHLESCPSCRRYARVVERGVGLLRALPPPPVRDDFRELLRHSIYHVEEERRRRRTPTGGAGAMGGVAMGVIVLALLSVPIVLDSEPSVDLPAIVIQDPSPAEGADEVPAVRVRSLSSVPPPFRETDLWNQSNTLLYEHSLLYQRVREPGLIRTGFE